jgi:hypothetical protein
VLRPGVAAWGLLSRRNIGRADNGACRPALAFAHAGSSGAMFAGAPAAGSHQPGSLNAVPVRYSFLHRFINIICHYTELHALRQGFLGEFAGKIGFFRFAPTGSFLPLTA